MVTTPTTLKERTRVGSGPAVGALGRENYSATAATKKRVTITATAMDPAAARTTSPPSAGAGVHAEFLRILKPGAKFWQARALLVPTRYHWQGTPGSLGDVTADTRAKHHSSTPPEEEDSLREEILLPTTVLRDARTLSTREGHFA